MNNAVTDNHEDFQTEPDWIIRDSESDEPIRQLYECERDAAKQEAAFEVRLAEALKQERRSQGMFIFIFAIIPVACFFYELGATSGY